MQKTLNEHDATIKFRLFFHKSAPSLSSVLGSSYEEHVSRNNFLCQCPWFLTMAMASYSFVHIGDINVITEARIITVRHASLVA